MHAINTYIWLTARMHATPITALLHTTHSQPYIQNEMLASYTFHQIAND